MPRILRPIALGVLVILVACGGSDRPSPADPPLVEIVPLAGQPPEVVDAALGPPTQINPIQRNPDQMPGEFRDYELAGLPGPLLVRFHRSRAVFFTVYLPHPEPSAEEALLRAGIDMRGTNPDTRAPMAQWWRNRMIQGQRFVKVGAVSDGPASGYHTVQVEIE